MLSPAPRGGNGDSGKSSHLPKGTQPAEVDQGSDLGLARLAAVLWWVPRVVVKIKGDDGKERRDFLKPLCDCGSGECVWVF